MADYDFKWFKQVCEEEGLTYDNIMVAHELSMAYGYACEVKWWRNQVRLAKRKPTDESHFLTKRSTKEYVINAFEEEVRWHNEKRIEHMLEAVEMAAIVKGLPKGFPEFLNKKYTADGSKIPQF